MCSVSLPVSPTLRRITYHHDSLHPLPTVFPAEPSTRTSARPSQGSVMRPLNNSWPKSTFIEPCSYLIFPQTDYKPSARQQSSLTRASLGRQRLANIDEVVLGGSCPRDGFPVVAVPCQGREVEGIASCVSGQKRTLQLGSPVLRVDTRH